MSMAVSGLEVERRLGRASFMRNLVSSYRFTFLLRLGGWKPVALLSRGEPVPIALLRVNFVETRALE